MTDGNTYAINKRLDEREDFDALQEVTAELEQAEADNIMLIGRIEELEAENKRLKSMITDVIHDTGDDPRIMASSRAEWATRALAAEAKLAKAACFITDIEAGPSWGESLPSWVNNRMLRATTILEELKGQDDE